MNQPEFEYLGPYRVEKVLGRGGMGTVYKGVHAKSSEVVAIKVIASGIGNNMRFRRRFNAEVDTLIRLKHPNIVRLIGCGEEQGLLFYAMEYVEGHSLHEHLRQHQRLAADEVIQIGIDTTAALKHAHDLGIIHRDLKPANLMLNLSGRVKLTDFGIAKLFGSAEMTAIGSVIGTADYMPPEQAEGKPVTPRSDLYSLGGVLYALLAGKAPFAGKSVPEVLYSVRYNAVPELQYLVKDVPHELTELIHQLLEKDPQKRPVTALVVGNRLKSMQQGLKKISSKTESTAKEPTAANEHVGPQLTSLDLSDVEDEELKLTGAEKRDGSVEAHSDQPMGTHELQTLVAPDGMVSSPSEEKFTAIIGGEVSDRLSHDGESLERNTGSGNTDSFTSGGPSHFTPVSEMPAKTSTFGFELPDEQPKIDWLHYGSIAGMAVLLLVSLGMGWWLLQPISADRLYDEISVAVASGDDAQLLQASGLVDEFLSRFPSDERSAELQLLSDEVELARWTRILQRRAAREGGAEHLSALEQAFLSSVMLLSEDASRAQQKLTSFVEVFGKAKDLSREEKKFVDLAKYAIRTGASNALEKVPEAAMQLQKLIEAAEASMAPDKLSSYYQDLISLYGDTPWAKQQMDRVRNKLETGS